MSGWVLYLFFMLDSFRTTADIFLGLSVVIVVIGLIIFGGGWLGESTAGYNDKPGDSERRVKDWISKWPLIWRWWRRILIPVFCVSLAFEVALPNTKQAIAIYVIPKVLKAAAQNKELMELPQDVVKTAKLYLNRVMVKWSADIEKELSKDVTDTSKAVATDSTASTLDRAQQAMKDAKDAYDKAMQALDAAKKITEVIK